MSDQPPKLYKWVGGRKNFNGFLFAILLTAAYFFLDVHTSTEFGTYAMWLAVDFLGTSGLHVAEDIGKARAGA